MPYISEYDRGNSISELVAQQKAMKLEKLTIEMLGTSRTVTVSQNETIIVDGAGDTEAIKARIEEIKAQYEKADSDYEKQFLKERMSKLIGGVAVLNIGAATEIELKEKKDRVDDALHATRAAVEEGIVPGGGIALYNASQIDVEVENEDQEVGVKIVKRACFAPFKAIVENAGKSAEALVANIDSDTWGYDARNDRFVDMFVAGIIDPTKVTRTAIELATSAASTLLTTECVISFDPEEKDEKGSAPAYY